MKVLQSMIKSLVQWTYHNCRRQQNFFKQSKFAKEIKLFDFFCFRPRIQIIQKFMRSNYANSTVGVVSKACYVTFFIKIILIQYFCFLFEVIWKIFSSVNEFIQFIAENMVLLSLLTTTVGQSFQKILQHSNYDSKHDDKTKCSILVFIRTVLDCFVHLRYSQINSRLFQLLRTSFSLAQKVFLAFYVFLFFFLCQAFCSYLIQQILA
eukprot:TRINITY_DN20407_c0_g1_i1.p2 TRINITY_DN20407_c0_g1~~TRINITY_DN20407_c0_g1_i1.p2  ORF type:complete len:208 (+),score=-7.33 TRINITY_DN20407_c0_g1_i1:396-1019(+)